MRQNDWHVNEWGKVEVVGIPHCQGRGNVGDIYSARKLLVVPTADGPAHPTHILADRVQERHLSRIVIFGNPRGGVPQ